jgi:DNA-directed RNA polymerase specialized sigma24 family protein
MLVELVLAARADDSSAWSKLFGRFEATLRSIAGAVRLAPADVDDVVQATWLDLLQDVQHVREPAAIAGWLATATRRRAMRLRRARVREHLTDVLEVSGGPQPARARGERPGKRAPSRPDPGARHPSRPPPHAGREYRTDPRWLACHATPSCARFDLTSDP